ncbi:MAG: hypothetical protein ACPGXL_07245 [Chitinophagales bacterium]
MTNHSLKKATSIKKEAPLGRYLMMIGMCIFLLFTYACGTSAEQERTEGNEQNTFFSLKDYFSQEVNRLTQQQSVLTKTAYLNGETETKTLSDVDWAKELQLFFQADINKTAWKDKYQKDSTAQEIRYTALDEQLQVRSITLQMNGLATVQRIEINKMVKNPIYQLTEQLTYQANGRFLVESSQTVRLMGTDSMRVEGKF